MLSFVTHNWTILPVTILVVLVVSLTKVVLLTTRWKNAPPGTFPELQVSRTEFPDDLSKDRTSYITLCRKLASATQT